MAAENQKLKLLYLAQILETETDDEHGLTCPQLIERLAERGVRVERKTLYNDLKCLRLFGYDIQKYHRAPDEYGLATREFQEGELLLLADAVQSSRFLTERKSTSLVKAISKLGSKYMAANLKKHLHVEGRIKSANESVYYNVDAIQRAFTQKRQVQFRYLSYNENKERILRREGKLYTRTPVQLIYLDDSYYLVVWSDKHQGLANFRLDRMVDIEVSDLPIAKNPAIAGFDVGEYLQSSFDMYRGAEVKATLRVKKDSINPIIDRFGKNVDLAPYSDDEVRVRATVMDSPTFFGWLTTLGSSVIIEQPASLRKSYLTYLQRITESYGVQ